MSWVATAIAGATVVSGLISSRSASRASDAQTSASRQAITAQERALERSLEFREPFRQIGLAAGGPLLELLGIDPSQFAPPPDQLIDSSTGLPVRGDVTQLQTRLDQIDNELRGLPNRRVGRGSPTTRSDQARRNALVQQRNDLQSQIDDIQSQQQVQQDIQQPLGDQSQQPTTTGQPQTSDALLAQINPLVSFLRDEGFEDIQESAAAQGRLRSGGTLEDLTQFNTNLAATVVPQLQQQRFNQLFNLLGLGSNAAAGAATSQLTTGANISGLLGNIGQAQAANALNQGQIASGTISNLAGVLGAQQAGLFNQPTAVAPQQTPITGAGVGASAVGSNRLGGF